MIVGLIELIVPSRSGLRGIPSWRNLRGRPVRLHRRFYQPAQSLGLFASLPYGERASLATVRSRELWPRLAPPHSSRLPRKPSNGPTTLRAVKPIAYTLCDLRGDKKMGVSSGVGGSSRFNFQSCDGICLNDYCALVWERINSHEIQRKSFPSFPWYKPSAPLV
jgi:hypothetical protein